MLMSSRQEVSEDQPFFKISSHNKMASQQQGFFLLSNQPTKEISSAVSMFQDPTPHQGKQHSQFQHPAPSVTTQSNYQASSQVRHQQRQQGSQVLQRERLTETSTHSSEKLTTLHSRLHQEAEKIRRWKVQTEIELKQQEQKLRDSLQTIESQRQSLLELQLQNETLSAKLKEEIDGRSEMEVKIEATRDLCSVVKDYSVRLEEKLIVCEQDRDDIQETQKKYQEDFVVLANKFEELSITHVAKVNNLQALIDEEKTKTTQVEANHQDSISDLENKIKLLQDDCRCKEENLSQLAVELQEKATSLNATLKEKESIQAFLEKSEASLRQYKEQIEKLNEELVGLQTQLIQSKGEKDDLCGMLETSKKDRLELDGIISNQKEDVTKLTEAKVKITLDCTQLKETVAAKEKECVEWKGKIIQIEETSKQSIDSRDEKLGIVENEKHQLRRNVECLEKQMREVLEEKDHLLSSINEGMELAQKKKADIAVLKDELKDVLEREKASYDKLDLLKEDIERARSENANLKQEKLAIATENSELIEQQKLDEGKSIVLMEKLQSTTDELAAHDEQLDELSSLKRELMEEIGKLSSEKTEQYISNQKIITKEKTQMEKLQASLQDLEKQLSSLGEKNKSMQGQIGQKTKQIKEQQQECKSIRAKNTVQTKQYSKLQKEVDKLNDKITQQEELNQKQTEEVDNLNDKIIQQEELNQEQTEEVDNLNDKIIQQEELNQKQTEELKETNLKVEIKEKEISEVEEKLAKLKQESETSIKDHDTAKAACEQQMKEVGATLEKYKSENQKIVAQKDKEIEKLQAKLTKESTTKKSEEKALTKQAETEKRNLKNLVEKLKVEKEKIKSDGQSLKTEVDEMMKQLKEKETLLASQKNELEALKKSQVVPSSNVPKSPAERVIQTPQVSKNVNPVTPKKNLSVRSATPKLKTPSHSILKSADTASAKKRSRVMFAPNKPKYDEQEEDDTASDSSTSQLMEIEMDDVPFSPLQGTPKKKQIPSQTVTPIRIRPSHKNVESPSPTDSPMKEQDLQLVPTQITNSKKTEGQSETANTRKTPKKVFRVKSWGDSPYRKKKKRITPAKSTKSKKEDISWLENDAVFGFFE